MIHTQPLWYKKAIVDFPGSYKPIPYDATDISNVDVVIDPVAFSHAAHILVTVDGVEVCRINRGQTESSRENWRKNRFDYDFSIEEINAEIVEKVYAYLEAKNQEA